MNLNNENVLEQLLDYQVPYIDGDINFWMIRTKKGYFFDEYIAESYVALGWNIIDSKTDIGSMKNEEIDIIKKNIIDIYGDKRPGQAINKCKRFIYELKEGDIVMIPGTQENQIAFAKIGEYYENNNLSEKEELDIITKIDREEVELYSVKCPYKKRRKINIIKIIRYSDLHIKLLKALSSYQGICNLNDYGKYILDIIYPLYYWREAYSLQMHVNTSKPIDLTSLTKVMQSVDFYGKKVLDENDLSVMLNLNSKGLVSFTLGKRNTDKSYDPQKDEEKYRSKGGVSRIITGLAILYFAIGGGQIANVKAPNFLDVYKQFRTVDIEMKKEEIDLEEKELDVLNKKIELYNKMKESGILDDDIAGCLDELQEYGSKLLIGNDEN